MAENPFRDPTVARQVLDYIVELEKLISENFMKPAYQCLGAIERVQAIRKELNRMGLYLTYEVSIVVDPRKGQTYKADVRVWLPKEDMSPEDRAVYDQWYARVNDLPQP